MRKYLLAILVGLALGWSAPVVAQVAQTIYGTTSGGTIVPILVGSTGRLQVTGP